MEFSSWRFPLPPALPLLPSRNQRRGARARASLSPDNSAPWHHSWQPASSLILSSTPQPLPPRPCCRGERVHGVFLLALSSASCAASFAFPNSFSAAPGALLFYFFFCVSPSLSPVYDLQLPLRTSDEMFPVVLLLEVLKPPLTQLDSAQLIW